MYTCEKNGFACTFADRGAPRKCACGLYIYLPLRILAQISLFQKRKFAIAARAADLTFKHHKVFANGLRRPVLSFKHYLPILAQFSLFPKLSITVDYFTARIKKLSATALTSVFRYAGRASLFPKLYHHGTNRFRWQTFHHRGKYFCPQTLLPWEQSSVRRGGQFTECQICQLNAS
jgi:hypothetical protein